MHAKQRLLASAAAAPQVTQPLVRALGNGAPLQWASGHGVFVEAAVLLDNQMRQGRAGLKVYQPLLVEGSDAAVLVDLGWVPMPANRQLPDVALLTGAHEVRGLLVPAPATGLVMGEALTATAHANRWLVTRLEPAALRPHLALGARRLAGQVLRLDPALPVGFARDLDVLPNTMPPARHLGYAVQWFGLALAVLVTALVVEWRYRRRVGSRTTKACQNAQHE